MKKGNYKSNKWLTPKAPQQLNFDKDVANFTDRQLQVCKILDSGKKKFILYGGALGGGKSYLLRFIAIRLLLCWGSEGHKNVVVMLACEDYPTLKDRQLSKIGFQFPKWLGKSYTDHKEYGRCYILHDVYGGGIICFRNLDDPSKYQSSEFAAILVDELTKNDIDTFNNLRMRLRWPGIPDSECPFIGATNPGGVGHSYCKALWIDGIFPDEFKTPVDYTDNFAYVPSLAEDNPYLDESYYSILNTLPPNMKAAFKDGSWDRFVGMEFQEWSREYHVIEPIPVPEGAKIVMTFDWGFGAPFSIGWWWLDGDGRAYRFSEWYGWDGTPNQGIRKTDKEIAAGIIAREKEMGFNSSTVGFDGSPVFNSQITRLCDPTCFNKKPDYKGGGQGPSTAEEFALMGLKLIPGDPNRSLKLRQFHSRLEVPRDENGEVIAPPMTQVYNTCEQFIRTIPTICSDSNNIEDVDSSGEDHHYDEAALLFMWRPLSGIHVKTDVVAEVKSKPSIEDVAVLDREQAWQEALGYMLEDW